MLQLDLTVNKPNVLTFLKQISPKKPTLNKDNITNNLCQCLDSDISLSQGQFKIYITTKETIF
jgi:hypothetical protein